VNHLWHVSDDGTIRRFEPRADPAHDSSDALVWAIETTTDDDVERYLTGDRVRRVHAIQSDWLEAFRGGRVFAYKLPEATFEPYGRAAGYWVSRQPVEPLEVQELDDLPGAHAAAGIELRIVPDLGALWERVIASTLEFSGVRLRNL
jgi:hypothetical protein